MKYLSACKTVEEGLELERSIGDSGKGAQEEAYERAQKTTNLLFLFETI